jgi:hypothetical protein
MRAVEHAPSAHPPQLPDLSWESRSRAFEEALTRAAFGRREAA